MKVLAGLGMGLGLHAQMSPASVIPFFQVGSELTFEEYHIYSLVIMDRFGRSAREQFVIRKELAASTPLVRGMQGNFKKRFEGWREALEGLKQETAESFVRRSCEPAELEEHLDLPLPYALLSEDESGDIWNGGDESTYSGRARDGWKVFRRRYPHAGPILSFSRIGFDGARTQALVETGMRAHWGVCGGALLLLQKGAEGWRIARGHGLWVS